jgi:hypothetical protein
VTWFIKNGFANSREAGVALGNSLLNSGTIHHISKGFGSKSFEDKYLFYTFEVRETLLL